MAQNSQKSKRKSAKMEHLRGFCWKPGESGNPGGRPKKPLVDDALTALLEERNSERAIEVARALLERAAAGDVKAAQLVAERTQGKPKQKVEVTGDDGGPVSIALRFVDGN